MRKMGDEVYEVYDHAKLNIYIHVRGGVLARRGPRYEVVAVISTTNSTMYENQ